MIRNKTEVEINKTEMTKKSNNKPMKESSIDKLLAELTKRVIEERKHKLIKLEMKRQRLKQIKINP